MSGTRYMGTFKNDTTSGHGIRTYGDGLERSDLKSISSFCIIFMSDHLLMLLV